jgi:aspartate aminotransferase
LFLQGQRVGYAAVSPDACQATKLATTLERLCRVMGFCTPTALMQIAIRKMLDQACDFTHIGVRRAFVLNALQQAGFRVAPSQATFFLYPQTPGGDDFGFAEQLAERGVLVLPAPIFHHSGYFRLSLTAPDEHIERAAAILAEVGSRHAVPAEV